MIINRSAFSGLYIARSGIVTAQGNLDITGQNMTNLNTKGYTRQRLDIRSVSDSGYKMKYSNAGVRIGGGVEAVGIQRLRDASLDARYRTENTKYQYEDVLISGLKDLQGILDETINDGLQTQLGEVLSSFQSLLADASGPEYINVVKNNMQLLNRLFNEISGNVQTAFQQTVDDLTVEVDTLNLTLQKLANLNDIIRQDKMVGNPALELQDERDLLLDQLSGMMDIRYEVDANDYEAMKIYMLDSDGNKHILVDNDDYVEFELRPASEEIARGTNISLNIKNEEFTHVYDENGIILKTTPNEHYIETTPPTQSIYVYGDDVASGSLGAFFDLLNSDGDVTNRGFEYYMERLDTLANTYGQMINDINRGKLFDSNGKIQITTDYLKNILADDKQNIYTANGDVFDKDLLKDALFGTTDIFPEYLVDNATGNLLTDYQGNFIKAGGELYEANDNSGYYTKEQKDAYLAENPATTVGFGLVDKATAGIENTRVYDNGKTYISETQYVGLKNENKFSYSQVMDKVSATKQIPSEFVYLNAGNPPVGMLQDYNGHYIKAADGKVPEIYAIDRTDQDTGAVVTEYCTKDQMTEYLRKYSGSQMSIDQVAAGNMIATQAYGNTAGKYISSADYANLTESEKADYTQVAETVTIDEPVPAKYAVDADGKLIKDHQGNYIKADADGTLPGIWQIDGAYYTEQQKDDYVTGGGTETPTDVSVTISSSEVYDNGEQMITADEYNRMAEGNELNYTVVTLPVTGDVSQIPSQFVTDAAGDFIKDFQGNYIPVDNSTLPKVYQADLADGEGLQYYTEEQMNNYLTANPGTAVVFDPVDTADLQISKAYDDGTGSYITETDYNGLVDADKANYSKITEELPDLYLYSTDKNLVVTNDNSQKITAGNIAISTEWLKDDRVLVNTIKENGVTGDNDNIQRFIAMFSETLTFHSDKYGDMFKGTIQSCSSNIMTTVGLDININESLAASYESNLNTINSNRMAVSSVDENEETSNLMMYQKAFQASSRVMTTIDEMLDKLINSTGMVGR